MTPTFFRKLIAYASAHKVISTIVLAVAFYLGYSQYKSFTSTTGGTRYVLAAVQKGTIVVSVTGSGQVSTSNQIDLKSKASGDITWIGVKAGDTVRAGQALAQIDSTTAKQAIADAEQTLAQAKLQFQKDSSQAPIDYQKSLESLASAKTDLNTTYNDTFNTLSTAYLDLPSAVTGMQGILYGYDLSSSKSQWNVDVFRNFSATAADTIKPFADVAERDYKIARDKYDQAIVDYKTLTRYSSSIELEKQLKSSTDTTTAIAQALQSELNLLDAVVSDATTNGRTVSATVNTMRTNTRNYLSTANTNLSSLLNQQKSLDSTKKIIRDNESAIEIYKIGNPSGNNPISLQSSQYSIADQERKLRQIKDDLTNYTVTAPFAGIVASFSLKQFDTVSVGTSAATLITNQKIAQLSFNEVDVAKVKVGQKATITFDAIDGLSIAGEVSDIDAVGTVSQGVVSYAVKVAFGTQDDRVKSGMSVSAAIVTSMKQDVLMVPNSAVKTQANANYVELFDTPLVVATSSSSANTGTPSALPPQQRTVSVGLSNDTMTEIISGLKEGEQVVARTILGSTGATQAPSIFSAAGVRTPGANTRGVTGR